MLPSKEFPPAVTPHPHLAHRQLSQGCSTGASHPESLYEHPKPVLAHRVVKSKLSATKTSFQSFSIGVGSAGAWERALRELWAELRALMLRECFNHDV